MKKFVIYMLGVVVTVGAMLVALADPPASTSAALDLRANPRQFSITVAASTYPTLRFTLLDNALPWTQGTSGYTGTLYYARTWTSAWYQAIGSSSFSSNWVDFDPTASQIATAGTWVAQVVLTQTSTARRVQWGRGVLIIEPSIGF